MSENAEIISINIPGTDVTFEAISRIRPVRVRFEETVIVEGKETKKRKTKLEDTTVIEPNWDNPDTFPTLVKYVAGNKEEWLNKVFGELCLEATRASFSEQPTGDKDEHGDDIVETVMDSDAYVAVFGESTSGRSKKPSLTELQKEYSKALETYGMLHLAWSQRETNAPHYREVAAEYDCITDDGQVNEEQVLSICASAINRFKDLKAKIEEIEQKKAERKAREGNAIGGQTPALPTA
jgi:hypothetical protein